MTAALPKWGATPLFEPTDWSKIAVTVLDVITEQQQILHLPLWSELPGCRPETAIYSDQPIQQRQGESLITAFGRQAAGSNLDARRTNATLMTASKRHTRKRKTFAATTRTTRSFSKPDGDSSDGPNRRRPPAPGWHGPDEDDDKRWQSPRRHCPP